MSGTMLSGLSARIIDQDQDLAFTFEAVAMPGKFVVREFEAYEDLFECYDINIMLASEDPDLDLSALVDTPAVLTILDKYSEPRYLHGVVAEASAGDTGLHRSFYSVVLRPTLHRLQYMSDGRIWQNQSVPDILSTIFKEAGIVDVEWRLAGDHIPREFCVCYGERLYDFTRRLLAEEGIFFWHRFTEAGHTLILSDAPWSMPMLQHAQEITYNAYPGGMGKGSWISTFKQTHTLRATDIHQKDYTFLRPAYGQDQKNRMQESIGEKGRYQLYDYPGRYKEAGSGKNFTQFKMEAERVAANTATGATNNIHLCAGFIFTLTDHPSAKANAMHRILSVMHKGTQLTSLQEDAPMGDAEVATTYEASFVTMPQRIPYRAINPTPKPQILGSQIATVVGPKGEEIYCDEFGRVKVQFPWDRYGKSDEHSSCWIRVAQSSGGGSWGHVSVPRIGNEVVVDYLEGDPDQPVILGMTFNAVNRPPYQLPGNKTKMALRSQTHKGSGHSEISMEDDSGREEMFIHAQKDQNIKVLNNQSSNVMANRVENIGANATAVIAANHMQRVGANQSTTVGGGGIGLLMQLMPLVQAGGKFLKKGAQKAGAPGSVMTFAGGVAAVSDLPRELAAVAMNGEFGGSGAHRTGAGAAQTQKANVMSKLISMVMPSSGTQNLTVEKFQKTTVGQAQTEQIGIAKNTVVGQVMTTSVGKMMKTKVGEDYELETKKSIFNRTVKHTLHAKEKFIIGGPGGTIIIDKGGVTIKAKKIDFKAPAVNFSSGSPDQVDALKSDKAFAQECKGGK